MAMLLFDLLFDTFSETRESYILIDQPKTWYEAQQYCREKHTDLVSIKNNNEDKKIKEKENGNPVWIGLFNNPWKWSHKGEYSSFHNWNKGEPNSVGNNICVEMYGAADKERAEEPRHLNNDDPTDLLFDNFSETSERYILIDQLKTWYEAQQYCRENYTDLVSIKNEDENKKIKEEAKGSAVWIGLFNNLWKWSDGGDNYTLLNWSEKQHDNHEGKEKCVMIQNKSNKLTINDDQCSKAHPFFCYDDTTPSVPPSAPASQDGKKLFLVNENKTWEEAVEYCRSNHTDLVSIESEQEHNRVSQEANKSSSSHVWLGLLQSCTFGFWYWVDGAQSCYDNWAPEPRCQSGCNQCGAMTARNGSEWTEKPCTERFNFICYNGKRPGFVF
ncbi:Macrophage mannose receptor 1 [Acipenser ruthenus]|uniref:Macrophage mannose receptor 1 n=1 Tax=Acipenser ruthenus TaxID=7906 RepID=A0A444UTL8_ACIRT|nr:Macrophage mannose receptor 1 [Acipenser ruthenus]